ncbi:MAG TPA: hypothetical protein VFQ16_13590 [Burkholderiaceae bacterium]|nr:hypothetical protein [Burkholderiaceae bacterium]
MPQSPRHRIAALPLGLAVALALSAAAHAESSASSASSAGSASVGSLSDSLQGSSRSSSGHTATAQGDYRVVDVAVAPGRPTHRRLTLQAVAPQDDRLAGFTLELPLQALGERALAVGELVRATPRPYGIEFARTDGAAGREPFFLALADDWHRGLETRAVAL